MAEKLIKNFRAVALDFDGTLAESHDIHTEARLAAYDVIAEETGDQRFRIPAEIHQQAHSHGSHPEEINAWILAQAQIIPHETDVEHEIVKRIVAEKKKRYNEIVAQGLEAMPGAVGYVRRLMSYLPGKVGIVTTAHVTEVEPYLQRHNLGKYIPRQRIVCSEDTPQGHFKPDPFAFVEFADRLQESPEDTLALEDSVRGIIAARRAGCFVVAIGTTLSYEELCALEGGEKPNLIAKNFAHLAELTGV